MVSKTATQKIIKEKVDSRASGRVKLSNAIKFEVKEGVFKHTIRAKVCSLHKDGNSVMFTDETYKVRNINVLDTKVLHKIMWQLITEREKKEIAYSDFVERMNYLMD